MKVCSIIGCERAIIARNLCTKHYQQAKAYNNLPAFGRTGRTIVPVTHPLYVVWGSMKTRCDNSNSKSYARYGALGVTYCAEWADFNNFYRDMHEGYKPGLWLDRIENTQGYCKDNCRWVTPTESNRNRRSVKVSEELALEIRERYINEGINQTQLGADYNLDQTTVSDIVRYKTWRLA